MTLYGFQKLVPFGVVMEGGFEHPLLHLLKSRSKREKMPEYKRFLCQGFGSLLTIVKRPVSEGGRIGRSRVSASKSSERARTRISEPRASDCIMIVGFH